MKMFDENPFNVIKYSYCFVYRLLYFPMQPQDTLILSIFKLIIKCFDRGSTCTYVLAFYNFIYVDKLTTK